MKKIFRWFLFLVLAALVYGSYSITPPFITKSRVGRSSDIKIIGHRGAAGLAPENTLPAIKEGLKYQVDRIEVDVRQTADSVLVIMHDSTVDRTTNGSGLVRELAFDDIRSLDAGKWFSHRYSGTKVPSLQEVIDTIQGKCELLIEVKEGSWLYPGLEEQLVDIIHRSGMKDQIIVQSFYDNVIFRVHELDPEIRIHKLIIADTPLFHYDADGFRFITFDRYDFVEEFAVNQNFASYRLMKKMKRSGKRLNVWTIRSEEKGEKFIKMNVGGIITDFPNFFNDIEE